MLNTLLAILSSSYIAWYLENHELSAVYPFDTTYTTPSAAGAPRLTEAKIITSDGAELIIWQTDATQGQPTVLYFSGNSGALKDRAVRLQQFVDAGFGVVAPAYRGSSGSTGQPEETVLIQDAATIAQRIQGPVVLYGESLGAAVAIQLASTGVGNAVVLEAPFTSLVDIVGAQFPMEDVSDALTQRWDSLSTVGLVKQPLLILHGETDRLVPFEMGEAIFAAAASPNKRFIAVPDQGHVGLWTTTVRAELFEFLASGGGN